MPKKPRRAGIDRAQGGGRALAAQGIGLVALLTADDLRGVAHDQ